MPEINNIRSIKIRDELEAKYISQSVRGKLYETTIYKIIFRALHKLFEVDVSNALRAINLNSFVSTKSHKECFKSLKGISSSKLSTLTSIRPILEVNKSDKCFRQHYEVAGGLNSAINIATMDWEYFEHLVRKNLKKIFLKMEKK